VKAESNLLFSCFGYKLPTILEIFGLKKPFPKTIIPKAAHINVVAKLMFEPNILALKNKKNWPIAIIKPPRIIQFLFPKKRSAINPPSIGVK
jgi:hypothetical protein